MHEIVEETEKGPRDSHCVLSTSIKRTYRVFRPTNHERSRRFSTELSKLERHGRSTIVIEERETNAIRRSLLGIVDKWKLIFHDVSRPWKLAGKCQMSVEKSAARICVALFDLLALPYRDLFRA